MVVCRSPALDIAFPCYDAGRWIDEVFQTLLAFDDQRWRVIARDDGSSDDTAAGLAAWRPGLGPRMLLSDEPSGNLGIIGNYDAVLAATSAVS